MACCIPGPSLLTAHCPELPGVRGGKATALHLRSVKACRAISGPVELINISRPGPFSTPELKVSFKVEPAEAGRHFSVTLSPGRPSPITSRVLLKSLWSLLFFFFLLLILSNLSEFRTLSIQVWLCGTGWRRQKARKMETENRDGVKK